MTAHNRARLSAGLITLFLAAIPCANWAADRYVSLDGTNDTGGGYTNWSGAATNIHWAVGVAQSGETIWVSNGVFNLTNSLQVTNAYTLRGLNGRDYAVINGQWNGTTGWNVVLKGGAIFDGLTMSNGYRSDQTGSGIQLSTAGHIRNSKITHCWNAAGVKASYVVGSITNCIITTNNSNGREGGGLYIQAGYSSVFNVSNCVIANNSGMYGGGVYISSATNPNQSKNAILSNCIISNNAADSGGGIYFNNGGIARNCLVVNNRKKNNMTGSGGGVCMNDIQKYGTNFGQMVNCTIVGNYGTNGGGISFGGTNNANSVINCIIYSNFTTSAYTASYDVVMGDPINTNAFLYSCVTNDLPSDRYCIKSNPVFTDFAGGNYRLRMRSPCVNAGTTNNQDWMTNAVDLDWNPRILNGMVDMGAYETILRRGTIFKAY